MSEVEVFSWNPRRKAFAGKIGRRLPIRKRANNFGDLLGPLIVERILTLRGLDQERAITSTRLLTVGSILHFARSGDVVWGSGINGKVDPAKHRFEDLDVRAVRGPLTARFLEGRGIEVPAVYGDPALLAAELIPELREWAAEPRFPVTIVPNLNEVGSYPRSASVLKPTAPLWRCLKRIARSRLVIGSSLHAIVIAESIGIQARVIQPTIEKPFKYQDYFEGTNRKAHFASSISEAVNMGGEEPIDPRQYTALKRSFPFDLWA